MSWWKILSVRSMLIVFSSFLPHRYVAKTNLMLWGEEEKMKSQQSHEIKPRVYMCALSSWGKYLKWVKPTQHGFSPDGEDFPVTSSMTHTKWLLGVWLECSVPHQEECAVWWLPTINSWVVIVNYRFTRDLRFATSGFLFGVTDHQRRFTAPRNFVPLCLIFVYA